jgi:hypothetical protein
LAGFVVAQRDCSNGRKWDESQQQQQHESGSVHNKANSNLSSEQQKEVLEGLASLLATALQTKQRQQQAEELPSIRDASGSSASICGRDAAIPDAAALLLKKNA